MKIDGRLHPVFMVLSLPSRSYFAHGGSGGEAPGVRGGKAMKKQRFLNYYPLLFIDKEESERVLG
ncbi:MAG: hypothetical protein PHQ81_06535 [Methanofollis sp.]|nr:hypothetical protein [Methanofollis sp.]